jgi:hypothetical protein
VELLNESFLVIVKSLLLKLGIFNFKPAFLGVTEVEAVVVFPAYFLAFSSFLTSFYT